MQQASKVVVERHGTSEGYTLGLDLGDRTTHFILLDVHGHAIERGSVTTTREALRQRFDRLPPGRVVLEVSTPPPGSRRCSESWDTR